MWPSCLRLSQQFSQTSQSQKKLLPRNDPLLLQTLPELQRQQYLSRRRMWPSCLRLSQQFSQRSQSQKKFLPRNDPLLLLTLPALKRQQYLSRRRMWPSCLRLSQQFSQRSQSQKKFLPRHFQAQRCIHVCDMDYLDLFGCMLHLPQFWCKFHNDLCIDTIAVLQDNRQ
ncbi:unnamed protein product [Cladocopium goreaui]|uniref:Uncharacterized protein n=1 Tax=Cladocopium goreaui TaxID=2562237 RepID=A0A9P1BWD8_9DINO|nr:unnamed protein product [Cladocopium goreaui]